MEPIYDSLNQDIACLGYYVDEYGYIKSYVPEHPHNNHGYLYAHRLVMERKLKQYGFELLPEYVVHHINMNKFDNRLENLYLTTIMEHTRIHNRLGSSYKRKPKPKV